MVGALDVQKQTARLDATFSRISALPAEDLELRSDYARYLCVLVAGYIETTIGAILDDYCGRRASPQVARYAGRQLGRVQNLNSTRLCQLLGGFDPAWEMQLDEFLAGERKAALDSVYGLRNQIAHGESVGVTYTRIKDYYGEIKTLVVFVQSLLV